MPNKKAKERKYLKTKLREWCKKYGRTKKQIQRYKNKYGQDSVPAPPEY